MAGITMADVRAKFPQYHDMSDDQLAGALHQKFYADMPQDQFYKQIGYSPASAEPKIDDNAPLGRYVLGAGEAAGGAIANIPYGIAHAATDIYHKVTGQYGDEGKDPGWVDALHVPEGQAAKDFGATTAKDFGVTMDKLGAGDAIAKGAGATDEAIQNHPIARDVVLPLAGDVATLAGARGVPSAVAGAAGKVAAGASGLKSLFKGEAFDTGAPAPDNGTGLRSGEGQNVAKAVSGQSGQAALKEHNQQVGNAIAAGEANHAGEGPLSFDATKQARVEPNDVYTRVGANLPEGQLDQAAQADVAKTGTGNGLVTASETAQKQIDNLKSQLANKSFTGDQLVDNLRSLRQEGYKQIGSEDVDHQTIGAAKLDLARAIEGHVERNIPRGADVTVDDFQAARKALAKNHAVEGALHGPDVDLKAIARMQRNDPQMLDGGLKDIADFANGEGRSVVGLPDTYHTPSFASDAAEALDFHHPVQGIAKLFGGRMARSSLTGDTAQAVDAARQSYRATPGRFAPRPGLTPPPGRAGRDPTQMSLGDLPQGPGPSPFTLGEGAGGPAPAPASPPGQLSLADLLSHGVEQEPAKGLSVGPMEAPPQQGLPFHADAGHMAGDLSLAEDHGPSLGDLLSDLQDHAKVMSQGVPEGTAARAPQRRFVGDTVDFPGGTPRRQVIENNASGESAASLEAQRRLASERSTGSAPFMIDPEGSPQAIAHTTDAVDVKAPKGALKVQLDPSTGKLSIMDRGGMSLREARGLLNRYMSLHGTKLGDAFGS
jgi:hypothetical protein